MFWQVQGHMKGDEEEDGGKRVKDAGHFENEFI